MSRFKNARFAGVERHPHIMHTNSGDQRRIASAAIMQAYLIALGRPPEPAAVNHWNVYLSDGHTMEDFVGEITSSPEFISLHGPPSESRFNTIRNLFRRAAGKRLTKLQAAGVVSSWLMRRSARKVVLNLCDAKVKRAERHVFPLLYPNGASPSDTTAYRCWLEDRERAAASGSAEHTDDTFHYRPTLSLLMNAENASSSAVLESIESIIRQRYDQWELIVAHDAGLSERVRQPLAQLSIERPQIKLVVKSTRTDDELIQAVSGEFVACVDPGDQLSADALWEVVRLLQQHPETVLVYSDEDVIDATGQRSSPSFKTEWNPDLLLAGDWVGKLAFLRRNRVLEVGGFRGECHPYENFDLLLRFVEAIEPGLIRHIPKLLYHRHEDAFAERGFPNSLANIGSPGLKRLVEGNLKSSGSPVEIKGTFLGGRIWPHPVFPLPSPAPLVSVIIPTRDMPELLGQCLHGVLHGTDYPELEILIVDNESSQIGTRLLFSQTSADERVRVVPMPGEFNWSAANNLAAKAARGSVLLFLNNDIAISDSDWLREIVSHVVRPTVGIVGAKLYYPDDRLQHGGMAFSRDENCIHLYRYADKGESGYLGQLALTRDVSAVTGACMAVRKPVFEELGGFEDHHLKVTWSDVDLCLKARRHKYRVVWTPFAKLGHFECASRGLDTTPERIRRLQKEQQYMRETWGDALHSDPFVNPNLIATEPGLRLSPTSSDHVSFGNGKQRSVSSLWAD